MKISMERTDEFQSVRKSPGTTADMLTKREAVNKRSIDASSFARDTIVHRPGSI